MNPPPPNPGAPRLALLSVVIPALNEEGSIESTIRGLSSELMACHVPHEIVVVDNGSADRTWDILERLSGEIPALRPLQNQSSRGFGRAVVFGLNATRGDAVTIVMADESDDSGDVVRYWTKLNEGFDCVFGSRFTAGSRVTDYPRLKLILNRLANRCIMLLFNIKLNDTTNAFKAYRKTVIDGCQPLAARHFDLTVELPLKAIVRRYTWTVIPIAWTNRRAGKAKLNIIKMAPRYFRASLAVLREKYFGRANNKKQ